MIRRLIIVAHDEVDLYDFIRRDNFGDETVMVITDRRRSQRRRERALYQRDRRHAERRQLDVDATLTRQGWVEVRLAP